MTSLTQLAASAVLVGGLALGATAHSSRAATPVAPAGSRLLFRTHAVGYQVYGCAANGEWSGAEPVAALVTAKGDAIRHYRDSNLKTPAWQAADGSVAHAALKDGKPDQTVPSSNPDSIPQLGLNIAPSDGQGMLGTVIYVIREHTKGGTHPSGACQLPAGTRYSKQYEADYLFFTK